MFALPRCVSGCTSHVISGCPFCNLLQEISALKEQHKQQVAAEQKKHKEAVQRQKKAERGLGEKGRALGTAQKALEDAHAASDQASQVCQSALHYLSLPGCCLSLLQMYLPLPLLASGG